MPNSLCQLVSHLRCLARATLAGAATTIIGGCVVDITTVTDHHPSADSPTHNRSLCAQVSCCEAAPGSHLPTQHGPPHHHHHTHRRDRSKVACQLRAETGAHHHERELSREARSVSDRVRPCRDVTVVTRFADTISPSFHHPLPLQRPPKVHPVP